MTNAFTKEILLKSRNDNQNFNNYGLRPEILRDIAKLGFSKPTPIQARCITPALQGKDIIGLAQTGTGKTAAFGLPIVQQVAKKMEMAALVLAPTRELAQQINQTLQDIGKSSGIRVALLVGGIPIKNDHKALRAWPNVVVATPGRLIDHIYSRSVDLSQIDILAVDEADRMYEMGFLPQIKQIIKVLPEQRQTLMFTATMPKQVENLVRQHMRSPVRVKVGVTAPAARAEQQLFRTNEEDKLPLLVDILDESNGRVLVFVRTKRKVDQLARKVSSKHRVARLHGDREQSQRETAINGFRNGRYRILIATDIAARGIDIADIEHVINYDFPGCPEDYIHRIGRTARAAASGLATSFVTRKDMSCISRLERLISSKISLTTLKSHAPRNTPVAPRSTSTAPRNSKNRRNNRSRRSSYTH